MRLDSYMGGCLLVLFVTGTAVGGLLIVRRRVEPQVLVACHEVGGYLLAVVGTFYAVLLGLIVVDSMTVFQKGRDIVDEEANALADIALLARKMPEGYRERVFRGVSSYAEVVTFHEWPAMDQGGHSPDARKAAIALIDTVFDFEPKNDNDKTLHDAQVNCTLQLWNSRRERTQLAAQTIPTLKWLVLIAGGLITVFFTYFFVIENLRFQALMTALVSVTISLNIYLVAMFGYPYSGDLKVQPTSYRVIDEVISAFMARDAAAKHATKAPVTAPLPGR